MLPYLNRYNINSGKNCSNYGRSSAMGPDGDETDSGKNCFRLCRGPRYVVDVVVVVEMVRVMVLVMTGWCEYASPLWCGGRDVVAAGVGMR